MQLTFPKWLWILIGGLILLIIGIVAYLLYRLYKSDNSKSFNLGNYVLGDIPLSKGIPTSAAQVQGQTANRALQPVTISDNPGNTFSAGGEKIMMPDGATLTLFPGRGKTPDDLEWIAAQQMMRNRNADAFTRERGRALLNNLTTITFFSKGVPGTISLQ